MRVPLKILSVALVFLTFKCGKAQEITCTEPDIEHRDVDKSPKVYTEGEALKYQCKHGYKPREGTPHCTRYGWSIRPECEVILCVFNATTFGKESIGPLEKTLFKAGETLEITCGEKYWIFSASTKSKICTCREDGTWDTKPVCQGKCGPPPVMRHRFADTVDIAKDEYDPGEKVEYQCYSKYTMADSPYMNCTDGEWTGNITCLEPCSVSVEMLEERNIRLMFGGLQKILVPHNDHITFVCQEPKKCVGHIPPRQKCNNGVMVLPECA